MLLPLQVSNFPTQQNILVTVNKLILNSDAFFIWKSYTRLCMRQTVNVWQSEILLFRDNC